MNGGSPQGRPWTESTWPSTCSELRHLTASSRLLSLWRSLSWTSMITAHGAHRWAWWGVGWEADPGCIAEAGHNWVHLSLLSPPVWGEGTILGNPLFPLEIYRAVQETWSTSVSLHAIQKLTSLQKIFRSKVTYIFYTHSAMPTGKPPTLLRGWHGSRLSNTSGDLPRHLSPYAHIWVSTHPLGQYCPVQVLPSSYTHPQMHRQDFALMKGHFPRT
jgi:hypothetical protein